MKKRTLPNSQQKSKKRKGIFGHYVDEQDPNAVWSENRAMRYAVSSTISASTTASVQYGHNKVIPLTRLCLHAIAPRFHSFIFGDNARRHRFRTYIPQHLNQQLITIIKQNHLVNNNTQEALHSDSFEFLVLQPDATVLDLEGFNLAERTIVKSLKETQFPLVTTLTLNHLTNITDQILANAIQHLNSLHTLNVRGCHKVGDKTALALSRNATVSGNLQRFNGNATALTFEGVKALLLNCTNLKVLKLERVSGLKDKKMLELLSDAYLENYPNHCKKLKNLKLKETDVTSETVAAVLMKYGNALETLDISNTSLIKLDPVINYFAASHSHLHDTTNNISSKKLPLTKLNLTSVKLKAPTTHSPCQLPTLISHLTTKTNLRKLYLGTMDLYPPSPTLRPYLTPNSLISMSQHLGQITHLSIFGNPQLTHVSVAHVLKYANQLEYLDLSHLSIGNDAIVGLVCVEDMEIEILEKNENLLFLNLSNTLVDDEATQILTNLPNLTTLLISHTRFTEPAIRSIVFACKNLQVLDLSSCRGVGVMERRTLFGRLKREREEMELERSGQVE